MPLSVLPPKSEAVGSSPVDQDLLVGRDRWGWGSGVGRASVEGSEALCGDLSSVLSLSAGTTEVLIPLKSVGLGP